MAAIESASLKEIIALTVQVLPLVLVPYLLKKSLDSIAGLGNLANKMTNRAGQRIKSKGKEAYGKSDFATRRKVEKDAKEAVRKQRQLKRLNETQGLKGVIKGGGLTPEMRAKAMSKLPENVQAKLKAAGVGEANALARANIISAARSADDERVKSAGTRFDDILKNKGFEAKDLVGDPDNGIKGILQQAAEDGKFIDKDGNEVVLSREEKIAAGQRYAQVANPKQLEEFATRVARSKDEGERRILKESITSAAKEKNLPGYGAKIASKIEQGIDPSDSLGIPAQAISDIKDGKVSADTLLSMGDSGVQSLFEQAKSDPEATRILSGEASKLLDASRSPDGRFGSKSVPAEGTKFHDALRSASPTWSPMAADIRSGSFSTETFSTCKDEDVRTAFKTMDQAQITTALTSLSASPESLTRAFGLAEDKDIGTALMTMDQAQITTFVNGLNSHPDEGTRNKSLARAADEVKTILDASHTKADYHGQKAPSVDSPDYKKLIALLPSYNPPIA